MSATVPGVTVPGATLLGVTVLGVTWRYEGWCRFGIARLRLADGTELNREIEDHGRAVCVLPYNAETRTALLIRQPRAPVLHQDTGADLLEAPAGLLDREDVEEEARREAMEEVGVRLGELERVVDAWSMPGISTERIALFLARFSAADRVGQGGGLADEHETIEVVEMQLAELAAMAGRGDLTDMKTYALVVTLQLRHPELFGAGAPE